jgi:hypothetical protein
MAKQAFLEAETTVRLVQQDLFGLDLRDFRPCISRTEQTVYCASVRSPGGLKRGDMKSHFSPELSEMQLL